ncbi:putative rlpA-like protein, double-psi beta-barrel [Medicago truncatula]|uniref:Putative rlpA-like protein, double-psi beta-barrel n=1 Tax=Medicago truncatula TaxID=3880 RepID=A0A396HFF1_MEDTR|nr:putative rlpA-like protein, double-psi beta-barrel [Medicago truncatula]
MIYITMFDCAVNEGLWDNGAACGRRYRIRCISGINKPCKVGSSIDVKVVDKITCTRSSCHQTFHMSTKAFAAISHASLMQISMLNTFSKFIHILIINSFIIFYNIQPHCLINLMLFIQDMIDIYDIPSRGHC